MSRRPPPVRRARPRGRRLGALVAAIVLITAVACSDDDGGKPEAADGATERPTRGSITVDAEERTPAGALPELTAVRLDEVGGARILVDSTGRQVLLNGASYNALADLPTAHAALPPNRAPTADDWDAMAALGFDVVRLEVSWSALEPERGRYDDAYLASIRDAVDEAAARRLYVVVAMHQEAWGPAVASPPDTVCPEGTQAALGGNGAPAWATLVEVAPVATCHLPGAPETAPAVSAAFAALYEDRDGLRGAYAGAWRRVVAALGDHPAVAGYQLATAPVPAGPDPAARYTDLLRASLGEVRAAEAEVGAPRRPVFVSPMANHPAAGSLPEAALALDDQLVLAPDLPAAGAGRDPVGVLRAAADEARSRGWGLWVAGYDADPTDEASVDALAAVSSAMDALSVGGAFDEWRRWCGDPESIVVPGAQPAEEQHEATDVLCPDDVGAGADPRLEAILARPRPRAAPGRITTVSGSTDRVAVSGAIDDDLAAGSDVVLWVPGSARPRPAGDTVDGVVLTRVPGGWYVLAAVTESPYTVEVR